MSLARVLSCAVVGLEGSLVEVEVDISNGSPAFAIVGLPDTAVQEAKERVRSAIRNSGGQMPYKHLAINLAPADLKKEGPSYDLPMALGILAATGQVIGQFDDCVFLGELGLDGAVRHTTGVLPMVSLAREKGIKKVFVPAEDGNEAALVSGVEVFPVRNLAQLMLHLNPGHNGHEKIAAQIFSLDLLKSQTSTDYPVDMSDIKGQEHVKRAMEVAASGAHNVLMSGPPGSGKTLIARCLPTIMPAMSPDEMLDVTRIYSVAGLLSAATPLISGRPFRSPHHTVSYAGLIGGGRMPRPGEITLAHRGVLFLDELPEFGGPSLDNLRQPLEDKIVTITRAAGTLTFPANFTLIAAMNPCPCGYFGDPVKACSCSAVTISRYRKKLSGPLLDRIDIHTEVPRLDYDKLASDRSGETSAAIRARVERARQIQRDRFANGAISTNSEMHPAHIREFCALDNSGQSLLKAATRQLNLSARGYNRVLKLARTIADLAASKNIEAMHLAEALQYRAREQA